LQIARLERFTDSFAVPRSTDSYGAEGSVFQAVRSLFLSELQSVPPVYHAAVGIIGNVVLILFVLRLLEGNLFPLGRFLHCRPERLPVICPSTTG
jgi:hypothetical protein